VTAEPLVGEGGADPEDGPFNSYEEVFANLAMNVEIPVEEGGTENLQLCDMHWMSVNTIKQNSNLAHETRCIVCNGEHRFENCNTLNNTAFLHQHCIQFCQNVKKDQAALTTEEGGNRPSNANVHHLDTAECRNQTKDSDEEHNETHFQHGHFQIR